MSMGRCMPEPVGPWPGSGRCRIGLGWPGTFDRWLALARFVRLQSKGAGRTTGTGRLHAGCPWQVLAVDLVGQMPLSARGNRWILVTTDHFTRWSDAIPIPDAAAPTVARVLEERAFCYMGLPKRTHMYHGAQFESTLMGELFRLWHVDKSRTTPYHPQANGVVEQHNRVLGNSLRAVLLERTEEEWDMVLPHIMRAHRGMPHSSTKKTPNFLMYGRELRLPDQVAYGIMGTDVQTHSSYVRELRAHMDLAYQALRKQQYEIRGGGR